MLDMDTAMAVEVKIKRYSSEKMTSIIIQAMDIVMDRVMDRVMDIVMDIVMDTATDTAMRTVVKMVNSINIH